MLGKVLEKIILNRIAKLSDQYNWISSYQHGFRKGKLAVTALENLTNQTNLGFLNKCYTSCVLLDIKGAFDDAWHPSIITTLKKKNCPDYLISCIHSLLSDRTATLRLYDTEFVTSIAKGCPQGSVLSLFLWNLIVSIQAFADDLIIIKLAVNKVAIQKSLQDSCDRLVNWGKINPMTFSGRKKQN